LNPVFLLSDGYIANGQEPWLIPNTKDLKPIEVKFRTDVNDFFVYQRNEKTLARDWVRPGTPGLEHRIGGLEKDFLTGSVSYDPANHEKMVRIRAEKVARIAQDFPPLQINGDPEGGEVLVSAWGPSYAAVTHPVPNLHAKGRTVSNFHPRYLNPLPRDAGEAASKFTKMLV